MDQDWTPVVLRKDQTKVKNIYVNKTSMGTIVNNDEGETVKIKRITYNTSQFIIKSRIEKKMTQVQVAKLCNLDKQIISNIERGDCVYNAQHVNKIARVLGVKIPRE